MNRIFSATRTSPAPTSVSIPAPAEPAGWYSPDPWIRFGSRTLIALIGASFVLSAVFTISGAIIASGRVTIEGAYQTIQSADGGIIRNILVHDGQLVKPGQPLIELEDTEPRAAATISQDRIDEIQVQIARLEAERDGAATFAIPPSLAARADRQALGAVIASQRALFKARQSAQNGQRKLLMQQINQRQSSLSGLEAQLAARRSEYDIAASQLAGIDKLYAKGFANKQQLASAKREAARLRGDLGRLQNDVARTGTAVTEARLRLAQLQKQDTQTIVEELRRLRSSLKELRESVKSQRAKLSRSVMRSPVAGYVHGLAVHTRGGVVSPGTPVMQIIPTGKSMIIEARLKPVDIDQLLPGQRALIRFPAFNARRTPQLNGKVLSLSPAQLSDPRLGDYFRLRIALPQSELVRLGKNHQLIPGMPAEIFIETTPRSIMSYFLKPLLDAMTHAMRET